MRTRSSRLNNGYIGDYAPHDDVNGMISANKKYLINQFNWELETEWRRPTQWRQGPSVSEGDQKIVITYAVYNTDNNFAAFTCSGNYTVDWGDGTSPVNYSSTTTASYNYNKTTYSGLTSDVYRSYKTLNIVITPQAGQNISGTLNFAIKHPQSGLQSYYTNNMLEVIMSAPNASGLVVSDTTFNNRSDARMLEHFRWIGQASFSTGGMSAAFIGCTNLRVISAFPSTANCTDFQSLFHSCHNLEVIPPSICEFTNATNLNYTFYYCYRLKKLPNLNTPNALYMNQTFDSCRALKRIPNLNTSKVSTSNLFGLFNGCSNLEETPPLIISSSITSLSYLFSGCYSLKTFKITGDTSNVTNFALMFANCTHLETIPFKMNTAKGTDFTQMFVNTNLKDATGITGGTSLDLSSATNITGMFRFCRNLEKVPDTFITSSALTTAPNLFYECYNLQYCPMITNMSNVTSLSEFFYNCRGIKTIPGITLSVNANTYTNMFFQNWNLSACGITGFTGGNVSVASCSLGATALNDIYRSLAVVGASGAGARTITVSGNWGTATDNTSIAIGKGWAVSG